VPPASNITRPITDRAKQSLFDILTPQLDDSIVYDCFAGTGSMGLECLSRGALHALFFESDREALCGLRSNIRTLNVADRSGVIGGDLFRWFDDPGHRGQATLVFLDPPYRFLHERSDDLKTLASNLAARHLADHATVIFRHDAEDSLELSPLKPVDRRKYGGMSIEMLRLS